MNHTAVAAAKPLKPQTIARRSSDMEEDKWAPAKTVLFVLSTSSLLWGAIILGLWQLV